MPNGALGSTTDRMRLPYKLLFGLTLAWSLGVSALARATEEEVEAVFEDETPAAVVHVTPAPVENRWLRFLPLAVVVLLAGNVKWRSGRAKALRLAPEQKQGEK